MTKPAQRRRIVTVGPDGAQTRRDTLAGEEPLEIRVGGDPLAVTMRTPGHDFDLVAGFLVSEGLVWATDHLSGMRYCAGTDPNTYNVIDTAVTGPGADSVSDRARAVYTTSSCGVCGLGSIDAVATTSAFAVADDPLEVTADVIGSLPDRLRAAQEVFDRTGGVHAAGLFTADGQAVCVREDVGRHNAVDKVVGWALQQGLLPLSGHVLQVSGRVSFELVQKAAMAGIPMLTAVSAPSSLAVDLAERLGVTVVGFSRGSRFNIYARPDRIAVGERVP